jgi:hypothetical protein
MFAITVFPFKSVGYFSRLFFSFWFIFGGQIGGIFNTVDRLNKSIIQKYVVIQGDELLVNFFLLTLSIFHYEHTTQFYLLS